MSKGSRIFNRLRLYFDQNLTAANAIDRANAYHHSRTLFHVDEALPYHDLPEYSVTTRQLYEFVNKLGNLLLENGLQRYDRVAIYKSNSIDYFFIALAVIKAGGVAVPINSGMDAVKAQKYMEYTGAKFLFTEASHYQNHIKNTLGHSNIKCWFFPDMPDNFPLNGVSVNEKLKHQPAELEPCKLHRDSDVMIVHTSGTTGFPKGVIATSGSVVTGIKKHYLGEPVSAKNKIAIAGHFNHLVCMLGLFSSMLGNFQVWGLSDFRPTALLDTIEKNKLNIFFAFPDIYLDMYAHGLQDRSLDSIRVWIATADASHEIHMKYFCKKGAFLRVFGKKIMGSVFIEPLGTSEVGFAALTRFYFPFSKLSLKRCMGFRSIGGPRIKVADANGKRVSPYKVGRLMIKGKTMFKGYWNAHDKLHNVIMDGWWWTGDMVYKDWLGRYYHLDRASDVISTAQGSVYSLLIEEQLLTHQNILESAVIGLPHPEKKYVPVGIVYPRHKLDATACLDWHNDQFSNPVPLEKIIISETPPPRGVTGKVLKRELRNTYAQLFLYNEG